MRNHEDVRKVDEEQIKHNCRDDVKINDAYVEFKKKFIENYIRD